MSRLFHERQNYLNEGDLASFIVLTDENDADVQGDHCHSYFEKVYKLDCPQIKTRLRYLYTGVKASLLRYKFTKDLTEDGIVVGSKEHASYLYLPELVSSSYCSAAGQKAILEGKIPPSSRNFTCPEEEIYTRKINCDPGSGPENNKCAVKGTYCDKENDLTAKSNYELTGIARSCLGDHSAAFYEFDELQPFSNPSRVKASGQWHDNYSIRSGLD